MSDISQLLIDQIKSAAAEKTPITIVGNDTKSHIGCKIATTANRLSTVEHSGIVEYKPVELIMTARAGTTLAEIDAELEKNNQVLASDPRRFGGLATLGGSLASNQSGHARPWVGSLRDHVLGIKLINGKGQHLTFGGQVMKNVAGYDVSRLQAGALGSFGLISEVSFKVLPKPEVSTSLSVAIEDDKGIELMNALSRTPKPINAACWVNNHVYVRLEGASSAVAKTVSQWQSKYGFSQLHENEANLFWDSIREHEHTFFTKQSNDEGLWKFSVNSAAKTVIKDAAWMFNWCGSQRWLVGDFNLSDLTEEANAMGGEVQHYSGGNQQEAVFYPENVAMKQLMRNLKRSFDPNNIFNPGRLYSWL